MKKYFLLPTAFIVFTLVSLQSTAQDSSGKSSAAQIDSLLPHNWLVTMVDWNGDKRPPLEKGYMNFKADKTVIMGDPRDKMIYEWSYDAEKNMIICTNKDDRTDNPNFKIVKISATELVLSFTGEGYPVITYMKIAK